MGFEEEEFKVFKERNTFDIYLRFGYNVTVEEAGNVL